MARKVVNRKALREEVEAAEKAGITPKTAPKRKTAKRKTAKRKSRSKDAVEPPKKLVWTVRNQAGKVVATYEYHDKDSAEKKAKSLGKDGKSPHFVQKDRLVIEPA